MLIETAWSSNTLRWWNVCKHAKKIRVGKIYENVEDVINLCFIDKNDPCYPGNILHIFSESAPVKRHNNNQLKYIPGHLITIPVNN